MRAATAVQVPLSALGCLLLLSARILYRDAMPPFVLVLEYCIRWNIVSTFTLNVRTSR